MLYYIDAFPERFHHPKEDRYLFPLLRARAPAVLDELASEHREGVEHLRTLLQTSMRYREGGESEFADFAEALEQYAERHRNHMRKEETLVLPLAGQTFTEGDWEIVDAAFTGHTDPLLGTDPGARWHRVFSRITNLAPPPIGVGSRHA